MISKTLFEVKLSIKNILCNRIGIDINLISDDMSDMQLLGNEWNLAARDLLYLFFDIEKEFGIIFPEEDVVAGKFDSINSISEIIYYELKKKEMEAV